MPELIDRQAALEKMCGDCKSGYDGHCPHPFGMCHEYESILQVPTIDAKPVRHGRWETIDSSFAHVYCSECGAAADKYLAKRYKGCPFCLCVMDVTDTNVGNNGGADNA